MSLDDVLEAASGCHVHGVDVSFAKKGGWDGNSGGNVDFSGLSKLALVTGVDVPLYVTVESGPPEAVKKSAACGVDALVAKTVVSFTNSRETLSGCEKKLVMAGRVASPESSVQ